MADKLNLRVGFIGGGVMGEAMIRGVLRQQLLEPAKIMASDALESRLAYLKGHYNILTTCDNKKVVEWADVVILAVKPQTLPEVSAELKGKFRANQTLISIIAGARIATLVKGLGHSAIVRVMPNTPAQIGQGMSGWTATTEVGQEGREATRSILQTLGEEIYVADENYIDMATAISASGPAYVFLIIEALTDAGVYLGFTRDVAQKLVLQTLLGSTMLVKETGKHPAELKSMVTSPGGTTAEALLALEAGGLRATLIEGVIAAYEKTKALGEQSEK